MLIALLITVSMLVNACQGGMPFKGLGGASGSETTAESQMQEDSSKFNSTVLGGTAAGCGIGAVVAALGCKLSGGDASKVRTCALAGCVVLGAVGAADGYYTAKQQQASRDKVRTTTAMAADIHQDNEKIQAFLKSSDKVLAESRTKLRELNAQVASRKISADQADAERKKVERNRDLMKTTLDEMKKSRDVYRDSARKAEASGGASRDLDNEIQQMNQKISSLERNVRDMNSALAVTRS